MERESLSFDRTRAVVDARSDVNFKAGLLCGAGHRQAIQQEGPILVDDIEQSSGWLGVSSRHSIHNVPVDERSYGSASNSLKYEVEATSLVFAGEPGEGPAA